jgi:hypothetical protein
LRVLLRIIVGFFAGFHACKGRDEADGLRLALRGTLADAYGAEVRSAALARSSDGAVIETSRAKSTLPFAVIHQVARLFADRSPPVVDALADRIGTVFWLTDDLIDLVPDFQEGALNSILAPGRADAPWSEDLLEDYPVLAKLLESRQIETAAGEVRARLRESLDLLDSSGFPEAAATRLGEALKFYVRNWME